MIRSKEASAREASQRGVSRVRELSTMIRRTGGMLSVSSSASAGGGYVKFAGGGGGVHSQM